LILIKAVDTAPKFRCRPTGNIYYNTTITDNPKALKAVTATRQYGFWIYDQLGGGFSRYSTDEDWLVPHFEKMLYDNAQLVSLYSHAYQSTKTYIKQLCMKPLILLKRVGGGFILP
jgi:uncharacterized protein YyaL (SSP411 family)